MKKLAAACTLLALGAVLGCDSDSEDEHGNTPVVTVTGPVGIAAGATAQLTASTVGGTDASYSWSSSSEAVATVDGGGRVTGVADGDATITATGSDTGAQGAWGVHVYSGAAGVQVTISGGFSVEVDGTLALSATTANGTDAAYSWASGDEDIATVDDSGVVTGVAAGEVVITATGADSGAAGSIGVVVMAEGVEAPFYAAWAGSGHADAAAEAFNHWNEDDPAEVPTSCARCHSTPGFKDFLGEDGSAAGSVEAAAPVGTTIECTACHNAKTVDLASVTFPSGLEVDGLGAEARCMQCHQGRESTQSVDEHIAAAAPADDDTVDADLGFVNVHYFAAAATRFGTAAMGGYQYAGNPYDGKFGHVSGYDSCIGCHDPHTLEVKVDECASCHAGVASEDDLRDIRMLGSGFDYDGDGDTDEGIAHELEGLEVQLYTALQDYAANTAGTALVYDGHAYPYFFIDTNGNGEVDEGEASYANQYNAWTARLLRAAYNYQYAHKDPGAFAHGGKYVVELLFDSIMNLGGDLSSASRTDAGHFDGSAEAWRHWDEDGEVSASCARCHSATGLPLYLATGGNTAEPLSGGLGCATCHGEIPDFSTRREARSATFPSGLEVDSGDNDTNLCMQCHQGRESTKTVDAMIAAADPADDDTVSEDIGFKNVHYLPAGATRYGTQAKGGYEYAGQSYDGLFPHVSRFDDCAECHDVHTQELKLVNCSACHTGVADEADLADIRMAGSTADYDGDGTAAGIKTELEGLKATMYAAIQDYAATIAGTGILYDAHSYPYWFIDTNGNGVADDGEVGYSNSYKTWTARLVKAAYNYQYASKDPGAFAHNGKYAIALLHDSIADLAQAVTVDMTGMVRNDSGHFDPTAEAWRHWDEDGEVEGACARCHGGAAGLDGYLAGGDSAPVPVTYGMSCETCHTGEGFAAGDAPRKAVTTVTFPGGEQVTDGGTPDDSLLCISCHQGRVGKADIDAAIAEAAGGGDPLGFMNVHYLAAGATLFGSQARVGYEYDGKTYASKFNHSGGAAPARCSFCHEVTAERHSFAPTFRVGTCDMCHGEATGNDITTIRFNRADDYDGDGDKTEKLADEVAALSAALYAELQTVAAAGGTALVYDGHTDPYFFVDTDGDGETDADETVYANAFGAWTPGLVKAAHNFQLSQKEPGAWAHNTQYIVQLLIDSIEDLGGDISAYTRP